MPVILTTPFKTTAAEFVGFTGADSGFTTRIDAQIDVSSANFGTGAIVSSPWSTIGQVTDVTRNPLTDEIAVVRSGFVEEIQRTTGVVNNSTSVSLISTIAHNGTTGYWFTRSTGVYFATSLAGFAAAPLVFSVAVQPLGMAYDFSDNTLWFTDNGGQTIRHTDLTGTVLGTLNPYTHGSLWGDIVVLPSGRIIVAEHTGLNIGEFTKVSATEVQIGTISITPTPSANPHGLYLLP